MLDACTKGDWEARRDDCHYDSLSAIYAGTTFIASVGGEILEEMEANTRLMAKAPEMLSILKKITTYYSLETRPEARIKLDLAMDIIKEAEGTK